VVMKIYIFWDITSCSPLKFNLRFVGTCLLHLQIRRRSTALLARCVHVCLLFGLFFNPEDEDDMFLRNTG
jgi:hypothetical protein